MFFTVIREKVVWQVKARSIQHLTQTLQSLNIKYLSIHTVREEA